MGSAARQARTQVPVPETTRRVMEGKSPPLTRLPEPSVQLVKPSRWLYRVNMPHDQLFKEGRYLIEQTAKSHLQCRGYEQNGNVKYHTVKSLSEGRSLCLAHKLHIIRKQDTSSKQDF